MATKSMENTGQRRLFAYLTTVPVLSVTLYGLLAVSPVLAWFVSLAILIGLSSHLEDPERVAVSVMAIMAGAVMISSRSVLVSENDDFARYYEVYRGIRAGQYDLLFSYGGGLEIGIPLLLAIVGMFSPGDNPQFLLFFLCAGCALTLYLWLELRGIRAAGIPKEKAAACVGASLVMLSLFDSTHIVRQMYASAAMLFFLTAKSTHGKIISLAISLCFHVSVLPILIVFHLCRKAKIPGIIALFVVLYSVDLERFSDILLQGDSKDQARLAWLLNQESVAVWLYGIVVILTLGAIYIIPRKPEPNLDYQWRYPALGFTIIYFLLLKIPGASFRACLLFVSLIPGYLIFARGHTKSLTLTPIFFLYLLYRSYKLVTSPGDQGLWVNFDWWGHPFYFLLQT